MLNYINYSSGLLLISEAPPGEWRDVERARRATEDTVGAALRSVGALEHGVGVAECALPAAEDTVGAALRSVGAVEHGVGVAECALPAAEDTVGVAGRSVGTVKHSVGLAIRW